MAEFWHLFSDKLSINEKFRKSRNSRNRAGSPIAEVYLVRFWGSLVELGLRNGVRNFFPEFLILTETEMESDNNPGNGRQIQNSKLEYPVLRIDRPRPIELTC